MTIVMINNTARKIYDQSRDEIRSGATVSIMDTGWQKQFAKDGVTYTLNPEERKNVPEQVARDWASADSEVNILWEGFE